MGYALKSQFDRREWFRKWRPGRRPFWDTQPRPLLGLRLVELLAFLDRIGLHGRLLTKGVDVESLQRARAIRAAKRRPNRRRKVDRSFRRGKEVPAAERLASRQPPADVVRSPHDVVRS